MNPATIMPGRFSSRLERSHSRQVVWLCAYKYVRTAIWQDVNHMLHLGSAWYDLRLFISRRMA